MRTKSSRQITFLRLSFMVDELMVLQYIHIHAILMGPSDLNMSRMLHSEMKIVMQP